MLNYIWLALVLLAVAIGGWNGPFKDVTEGALGISHSHSDIRMLREFLHLGNT